MARWTLLLVIAGGIGASVAACGPVATNKWHPILEVLEQGKSAAAVTASAIAPVDLPPSRPQGEKNTSVQPSRMSKDLAAMGFDLKHLLPMRSLSLDQKKKMMPLFAKALGYAKDKDPGCTGCHVAGDYKAETRNRALAREMYDRWSVNLALFNAPDVNGTLNDVVFCDSCHASQPKVLNRSDSAAVKAFMKAEYTDKLTRKSEGSMTCATCHGEDLEIAIFDKVWKVPKASTAASAP